MLNLFSESGKSGTWRGEGFGPCIGCAVQLRSALNEAANFFCDATGRECGNAVSAQIA
jgi:hypothetical protein